jgi:hypothetical protein
MVHTQSAANATRTSTANSKCTWGVVHHYTYRFFFFRKPILIGSWIEYLSPHQIVLRGWHSPMWVPLIHGRGIHGMTYRPGIPIGPWWSRNHVIFAIFI